MRIFQRPKKRLEFCEISHERGPRSPAGTPKDRTTPTPSTASAGGRRARRHTTTAARGAAIRRAGYRSIASASGYPGGAAYTGQGGYPAGGYVRGATGRTWRGSYRGGRIPGGGATGANGAAVAPTWAATGRGASSGGEGYLCRGVYRAGLFRGAATPGGRRQAARRHSYPRRGGYPGGLPGRETGDQRGRLVTGIRRL